MNEEPLIQTERFLINLENNPQNMDLQLPILIKMIDSHIIDAMEKSQQKKLTPAIELYSCVLGFQDTILQM